MASLAVMCIVDRLEKTGDSCLAFWGSCSLWSDNWMFSFRFYSRVSCRNDGEYDDRRIVIGMFPADRGGHWQWRWLVVSGFRLLPWMAGKSGMPCYRDAA